MFNLEGLCFLLYFIAFPFAILIYYFDWRFNRIYLTNFRLVKERGIIGKRFMSIFYEQIEDITIWHGFWRRVFNFGDLEIESAGTYGEMIIKGAPNPQVKKWLILNEIQKMKRRGKALQAQLQNTIYISVLVFFIFLGFNIFIFY